MKNKFFSKSQRIDIVILMFLITHLEKIIANHGIKWFAENGTEKLIQASKLIFDALKQDLSSRLSTKESLNIHKDAQEFEFIVKTEKEPSIYIPIQHVYDLAEKAIGNECTGCSIEKYKKCNLYQRLHELNIPEANKTKNVCPYRQ
jgi:hypothetical protein